MDDAHALLNKAYRAANDKVIEISSAFTLHDGLVAKLDVESIDRRG